MRQVLGIFVQTLRAGLRMRGFWVLVALLVAIGFGLPRGLRGDGTVEGSYDVIVRYTLGLVAFVLVMVGAASGAGTLAADRRTGVLALTLVKPVRGVSLFIGKWLGVLALNALLLALAYAVVLTPLRFGAAENGEKFSTRMISNTVIGATLPSAKETARAMLDHARREGMLPTNVSERVIYKDLLQRTEQAYDVANSGESLTWNFDIGHALRPGEKIGLRVQFDQQWGQMGEAKGVVDIRPRGTNEWFVAMSVEGAMLQEVEVPFATTHLVGHSQFEVRFTNAGAEHAEPVLIHPRRGVALLIYDQNFGANVARAYAVQLALIGVFIALGVVLGSAFSLPVASFVAVVIYVLVMISPALTDDIYEPGDDEEKPSLFLRAGQNVTLAFQKSFSPLLAPEPLSKLTNGDKISASMLSQSLIIGFVLFPGVAMLLMHVILRRRVSQC